MGKVRVRKSRVHLKASITDALDNTSVVTPTAEENRYELPDNKPSIKLEHNPFRGIEIDFASLQDQKLQAQETNHKEKEPHSPNTNVPSKKKDRIKEKREKFLNKLQICRTIEKEKEKKKKRSQMAVVGDLHFLKMALPDLETSTNELKHEASSNNASNKEIKQKKQTKITKSTTGLHTIAEKSNGTSDSTRKLPTAKRKNKQRQKQAIKEIENFQKLMKNKSFQENNRLYILKNLKLL